MLKSIFYLFICLFVLIGLVQCKPQTQPADHLTEKPKSLPPVEPEVDTFPEPEPDNAFVENPNLIPPKEYVADSLPHADKNKGINVFNISPAETLLQKPETIWTSDESFSIIESDEKEAFLLSTKAGKKCINNLNLPMEERKKIYFLRLNLNALGIDTVYVPRLLEGILEPNVKISDYYFFHTRDVSGMSYARANNSRFYSKEFPERIYTRIVSSKGLIFEKTDYYISAVQPDSNRILLTYKIPIIEKQGDFDTYLYNWAEHSITYMPTFGYIPNFTFNKDRLFYGTCFMFCRELEDRPLSRKGSQKAKFRSYILPEKGDFVPCTAAPNHGRIYGEGMGGLGYFDLKKRKIIYVVKATKHKEYSIALQYVPMMVQGNYLYYVEQVANKYHLKRVPIVENSPMQKGKGTY